MECTNIRGKLSDYLEDVLPAEERVTIDEHLRSCESCSAELTDLRRTIERIRGLEEVEPPSWMTQKIMAKVREEGQRKKGVLQRLFYPLRIKLPLEAVAALLIIGVALYIYRDISPEIRLAKAPTEESAPQILRKEIIKEDKKGLFRKSEEKNIPQEVITVPEKPAEEATSDKFEAKTDKTEAAAPKAPETQKQIGFAQKEREIPSPPATEAARSAAGTARQEARQEALQAAPRLKASAEMKIERMVLTVKVKELESASREIEKTITALGGKIIERESVEGKKTVVIEVNSNGFNELLEKLKSIGEVKEETKMRKLEGAQRVKIEVVESP